MHTCVYQESAAPLNMGPAYFNFCTLYAPSMMKIEGLWLSAHGRLPRTLQYTQYAPNSKHLGEQSSMHLIVNMLLQAIYMRLIMRKYGIQQALCVPDIKHGQCL